VPSPHANLFPLIRPTPPGDSNAGAGKTRFAVALFPLYRPVKVVPAPESSAALRFLPGRYLREPYHGEPYATRYLCAEAFHTGEAHIPAEILRERLPETLRLAEFRERTLYHSTDADIEAVKESYRKFVALCEAKEKETGESVLIIASH